MEFSLRLEPLGLKLPDPYPGTSWKPTDGPVASIHLDPGQKDERTIVLNQFAALEQTRNAAMKGKNGQLHIAWKCYVAANNSADHSSPEPVPVSGTIEIPIVQDEARLRKAVDSLAATLQSDAQAISVNPVARRDALVALTSLRIPETVPHLRALAEFPNYEVRSMAQMTLREMGQ